MCVYAHIYMYIDIFSKISVPEHLLSLTNLISRAKELD